MLFIYPRRVSAHTFHCSNVRVFGDRALLQTTRDVTWYSIHAQYFLTNTQDVPDPWACGIWVKNGGPAFHPVVYLILTLVLDDAVVTYKVL